MHCRQACCFLQLFFSDLIHLVPAEEVASILERAEAVLSEAALDHVVSTDAPVIEASAQKLPTPTLKKPFQPPPGRLPKPVIIRKPYNATAQDALRNWTVGPLGTSYMAWWEGHLSGMTARRLISISPECVVMCYSRRDGGGCQVAKVTIAVESPNVIIPVEDVDSVAATAVESPNGVTTVDDVDSVAASTKDDRLPPPLPWGQPEMFLDRTPVGNVQLERMSKTRFVVCFDRPARGTSVCHVGVVKNADEGADGLVLIPFGDALDLGTGRLVSVTPVRASRFAACNRPGATTGISTESEENGQIQVSCRFAEIHEVSNGNGAELRWMDIQEPIPVTWKTGSPRKVTNATVGGVTDATPEDTTSATVGDAANSTVVEV